MDSRRDFIKKAALLSGAAGVWSGVPASIQSALAIEPEAGTTYLDAEHVVILMQENRSFDHCFGTLRGVRGFNDPRALTLADRKPVWLQTNAAGETYAPFRLNIRDTNATWMGSLPHSWTNQVDALHGGKHDRWLDVKHSGNGEYAHMPLTMGHYIREDIPFYYAFADAFTVCDQHFCSSLTGTTPNRLYLWTGTVRPEQNADSIPRLLNEQTDYGAEANWTTFPERLEDHGVSWKIYQNEIDIDSGFQGEEESWLANYSDSPIEWFTQYHVRFAPAYRNHLQARAEALKAEIDKTQRLLETAKLLREAYDARQKQLDTRRAELAKIESELARWSEANFEKLSEREKSIHRSAFCNNAGDPAYRKLATLTYLDGQTEREVSVPAGDVLHQFRDDVKSGNLPTVSWLVASENFSDHPSSAWYGAWYVSEVLDILTRNPEVWKKTIFILTYDENDGYFDHVPPFTAPDPSRPETGRVSAAIDASVEYVTLEQELKHKHRNEARESSIGLGYRVPMVIASPWSRGGCVCSQVFDHTSVLQFLETYVSQKTGKPIEEANISRWRRTVCGDLTSAFEPYNGEKLTKPRPLERDAHIRAIHQAKFKQPPSMFHSFTAEEIDQVKAAPHASPLLSAQEPGIRRSCALPYQLYVDGALQADRSRFTIDLRAGDEVFGKRSAGSPFNVYALGGSGEHVMRAYAVTAGDRLTDAWELSDFHDGVYHLKAHGPNGFLREFVGGSQDPTIDVRFEYGRSKGTRDKLNGSVEIRVVNHDTAQSHTVQVKDNAYRSAERSRVIPAGGRATIVLSTQKSFGWYDFTVRVAGVDPFERRAAGRVETGAWSFSDPLMGRVDLSARG